VDHVRQALPVQREPALVAHALPVLQVHALALAPVLAQAAVHQVLAHQDRVAVAQVVAVAALVLPEPSVRAADVTPAKPASQNAPNVKSLNSEAHQALAAQLCHAVTAVRSFVYVAVPASRTLQTRLTPMPVS
jgi:hypothetical protein